MKYHIRIFGDPVLRIESDPVTKFDENLKQLADDMIVTMRANAGAGLAAQQIGLTDSICIVDVGADAGDLGEDITGEEEQELTMPMVLVNPRIIEKEGDQTGQEGCLSFPEIFISVKRAEEVVVEYDDLEGNKHKVRARELLSRAIQHELDHLNAILLVDHMTPVQKVAVAGKLKRMKKRAAKL